MKKRMPVIERVTTPNPANRYGIVLKNLNKAQKRLLVFHRTIADKAQDDQCIQILFDIYGTHNDSDKIRVYYDRTTDSFVKKEEIIESYNTVDWKCAVSGRPIKAKFMEFNMENFIHEEFLDVLKAPMVDSRILKSTIEFRKYCQNILLQQQKDFMDYSRRSATSKKLKRLQ